MYLDLGGGASGLYPSNCKSAVKIECSRCSRSIWSKSRNGVHAWLVGLLCCYSVHLDLAVDIWIDTIHFLWLVCTAIAIFDGIVISVEKVFSAFLRTSILMGLKMSKRVEWLVHGMANSIRCAANVCTHFHSPNRHYEILMVTSFASGYHMLLQW